MRSRNLIDSKTKLPFSLIRKENREKKHHVFRIMSSQTSHLDSFTLSSSRMKSLVKLNWLNAQISNSAFHSCIKQFTYIMISSQTHFPYMNPRTRCKNNQQRRSFTFEAASSKVKKKKKNPTFLNSHSPNPAFHIHHVI